jgi:hypothetical protein
MRLILALVMLFSFPFIIPVVILALPISIPVFISMFQAYFKKREEKPVTLTDIADIMAKSIYFPSYPIYSHVKKIREEEEMEKELAKPALEKKIQAWQTAMNRWNRLYYCWRDDVVFDLDTGKYFTSEQMMNYLYSAN